MCVAGPKYRLTSGTDGPPWGGGGSERVHSTSSRGCGFWPPRGVQKRQPQPPRLIRGGVVHPLVVWGGLESSPELPWEGAWTEFSRCMNITNIAEIIFARACGAHGKATHVSCSWTRQKQAFMSPCYWCNLVLEAVHELFPSKLMFLAISSTRKRNFCSKISLCLQTWSFWKNLPEALHQKIWFLRYLPIMKSKDENIREVGLCKLSRVCTIGANLVFGFVFSWHSQTGAFHCRTLANKGFAR